MNRRFEEYLIKTINIQVKYIRISKYLLFLFKKEKPTIFTQGFT